eukprot:6100519-Amphidinium_carterae.1
MSHDPQLDVGAEVMVPDKSILAAAKLSAAGIKGVPSAEQLGASIAVELHKKAAAAAAALQQQNEEIQRRTQALLAS